MDLLFVVLTYVVLLLDGFVLDWLLWVFCFVLIDFAVFYGVFEFGFVVFVFVCLIYLLLCFVRCTGLGCCSYLFLWVVMLTLLVFLLVLCWGLWWFILDCLIVLVEVSLYFILVACWLLVSCLLLFRITVGFAGCVLLSSYGFLFTCLI